MTKTLKAFIFGAFVIGLLFASVLARGSKFKSLETCPFPADVETRSAWQYALDSYEAWKKGSGPRGGLNRLSPLRAVSKANFIDDYIFAKMERDGIPHADLCTDGEFIRRVYLDLTGRIPSAEAVRNFLNQSDPDKRAMLVDSLIGTPEFVDRWTLWFNDFFKNSIYPVSVYGRNALHSYVKNFVHTNKPYNQVVQELITAEGDNFSVGPLNYLIKAGGADANVTLDIYDDLAVATAKIFSVLKCFAFPVTAAPAIWKR